MSGAETFDSRFESVPEALARRAAETPEEPWLFFQRGWDWRWRSYLQVADQAARGAALLHRRPELLAEPLEAACGQDPDAIAVGLAIEAAGGVAVPRAADVTAQPRVVRPAAGGDLLELPACRSRLERWRPRALELMGEPRRPADVSHAVAGLDRVLPAELARRGRPILCADSTLEPPAFRALLAWTLERDVLWALEPSPEAFLLAVLWTRPTVVIARASALEGLVAALVSRRSRRYLRLRVVVVVGGEDPADETLATLEDLGVAVARWPPGARLVGGE